MATSGVGVPEPRGGILGIGVLLGCSVVGLSGVNGFGILCGCVGACVFC